MVVALALIWALAIGYCIWDLATYRAEQRVEAGHVSAEHRRYAEDQVEEECRGTDPAALRDCIYEQVTAAEDHARAEQDLKAQQTMALFTRIMAYTALGSLVSIPLIYVTFLETKEANRIATENAAIERRPWVVMTDPVLTSIHILESGFEGKARSLWIEWEVRLKNSGLTPALAVRVHSRLGDRFADGWMQDREALANDIIDPLHPNYGFSLAPGEEQFRRFNATFDFDPAPHPQGGHAGISLGIHIAASYQEPVDETRRLTEATFEISHNRTGWRMTNVQPIFIKPEQLAFPNKDAQDGNTHLRVLDVDNIEVRRVGGTMI